MNNKPSTNRNFVFKNDTINISQDSNKDLDLKSIAEWIACGFFLGDKNFTMQKYGEKEKYTHLNQNGTTNQKVLVLMMQ